MESPASTIARESDHAIKPEVVVTICFGLVMFLLALLALWQGHKQRRRTALKRSQTCCWRWPLNATTRETMDNISHHWSSVNPNSYLNGNQSSQTRWNVS